MNMNNKRLMVYVGCNPVGNPPKGDGITVFEAGGDGYSLKLTGSVDKPVKTGCLYYLKSRQIIAS
jgi:hypothetical protein